MDSASERVHRPEDGELVGHLQLIEGDSSTAQQWSAMTVFGRELDRFDRWEDAVCYLRRDCLAVLAEKWWYRPGGGQQERLAYLIEAARGRVTVRFGPDPASHDIAVLTGPDLHRLSRRPS